MKIKILFIAIVIFGLLGTGYYFLFSRQDEAGNTVADNAFGWQYPVTDFPITGSGAIAYSDIRDPGGIPEGLPVRLKIPAIGVDSAIEDALITPDGRMDVPAGTKNVAWFALGPHPGQVGSAVIGGHYGIYEDNRGPTVFYYLDKMKAGDKIYIEDDKGDTLAFQVRSIKLFDRNADAKTVFTSNDGLAHLNLITCEGIWNRVAGTYPSRRVVFTDAIPTEAISKSAPITTTFPRLFGIGARGADVSALQTFLVQKGFLKMPVGVAYGYFGALTAGAVAKYQTSVGLTPVGVFGPLTRVKVIAALASVAVLPNAGITAIAASSAATSSPAFTTPAWFIISLIIVVIAFIAFKIFRR